MGIMDHGLLKEGYAADIVVFDAATIENLSEYTNSKIRPKGIDYVIVNGEIAMEHNRLTNARSGKMLLHKK